MRAGCLAAALACAACSSSTGGTGGTGGDAISMGIDGKPFAAADAITKAATASGIDFNGVSTLIQISSFPSACSNQQNNVGVANGKLFFLALANIDASGAATPVTAPGTFTITSSSSGTAGTFAEVFWEADGPDCLKMDSQQASSGTVQITRVDASGVAGMVDATFDGNVKVTGTFDAATCSAFDPNRTPGAAPGQCH